MGPDAKFLSNDVNHGSRKVYNSTMGDIGSLIRSALDPRDASSAESSKAIVALSNDSPADMVASLANMIRSGCISEQSVPAYISLICQCLKILETKNSSPPFADSSLIDELQAISFGYFQSSSSNVRGLSIKLAILLSEFSNIEAFVDNLASFLNAANSHWASLSASYCITEICKKFRLECVYEEEISASLMRCLETNSIEIASEAIGVFESLVDRLPANFCEGMFDFFRIPPLKPSLYSFFNSLLSRSEEAASSVPIQLLDVSLGDLNSSSNRETINACAYMWECLTLSSSRSCSFFSDVAIPSLFPKLITLMHLISPSDALSLTEWEPSLSSFSCIRAMASAFPHTTSPLIAEFVSHAVGSLDPIMMEVALKSLAVACESEGFLPTNLSSSVEFVKQSFNFSEVRVIYFAIFCLSTIISHYSESCEPFLEFIIPLTELSNANADLEKEAFECISLIASIHNFCNKAELMMRLFVCLRSSSSLNAPPIIKCFKFLRRGQIDQALLSQCIIGLIEVLSEALAGKHVQFIDSICSTASYLILDSENLTKELYIESSRLFFQCYEQLSNADALAAICSFSVCLPNEVRGDLSRIMQAVIQQLSFPNEESEVVTTIFCLGIIIQRIGIDELFEDAWNSLIAVLYSEFSLLLKSHAVCCISLMCDSNMPSVMSRRDQLMKFISRSLKHMRLLVEEDGSDAFFDEVGALIFKLYQSDVAIFPFALLFLVDSFNLRSYFDAREKQMAELFALIEHMSRKDLLEKAQSFASVRAVCEWYGGLRQQ